MFGRKRHKKPKKSEGPMSNAWCRIGSFDIFSSFVGIGM
jgi:hypothetical protein